MRALPKFLRGPRKVQAREESSEEKIQPTQPQSPPVPRVVDSVAT